MRSIIVLSACHRSHADVVLSLSPRATRILENEIVSALRFVSALTYNDSCPDMNVPQDPFETDFNVARCVTRDGLYTVRSRTLLSIANRR